MAERRQFIRQDPPDAEEFTGLEGEFIVELGTFRIRVHDGITPGGFATLTQASAEAQFVTLVTFNQAVEQILEDVTVLNDEAIEEIFGNILIAKGPVADILTGPPVSPAVGDRYLVAAGGTSGAFVGHENQVAEWLETEEWIFSGEPDEGHFVYVQDVNTVYYHDGSSWSTTNPDETYQTRQEAIDDALDLKAPLASPDLTGTPTAPTATTGTNTTQIATTAFVQQEIAAQGLGGTVGTEGSQTLGDIILKWGFYNGGSANPTVNFADAFPNSCFNVQCTPVNLATDTPDAASTRNIKAVGIQSISASGFSTYLAYEDGVTDVFKADNTCTFYWVAIGR